MLVCLTQPSVTSDRRPVHRAASVHVNTQLLLWFTSCSGLCNGCSSHFQRSEKHHINSRWIFQVVLLLSTYRWLPLRTWKGREREATRTLITCSSCWSLATAAWAKRLSSSATPTMPSLQPSSAPWALTSKWKLCTRMTRGSNCKFGYEILTQKHETFRSEPKMSGP